MHKINIYMQINKSAIWLVCILLLVLSLVLHACVDPDRGRQSGPPPIWKITSDIRFPQKYWYGPPSKEKEKLP